MKLSLASNHQLLLNSKNAKFLSSPNIDLDMGLVKKANAILISDPHVDAMKVHDLQNSSELRVFYGPGEYESFGVLVTGIPIQTPEAMTVTLFYVVVDGYKILIMPEIIADSIEDISDEIDEIDIVAVPFSTTKNETEALSQIVKILSPKILLSLTAESNIINEELDRFLSKHNIEKPESVESYTIVSSDLGEKLSLVLIEN